jgi:hypothetical protein
VWVSWRMDETYVKVKGQWRYLYRAVDKYGATIDFLLTEHRDKEAALRFLKKAIRRNGVPETITIDGSDANEAAIKSYNEEHGTAIAIRQVKYLNNIVEQDHRAVKRITRPMLGWLRGCAAGQPEGTSGAWQKYSITLRCQWATCGRPLERFGHRAIEIVDEGQDALPQILNSDEVASFQ